jgi:hypothetical protein
VLDPEHVAHVLTGLEQADDDVGGEPGDVVVLAFTERDSFLLAGDPAFFGVAPRGRFRLGEAGSQGELGDLDVTGTALAGPRPDLIVSGDRPAGLEA